jgi:hypothetical protein
VRLSACGKTVWISPYLRRWTPETEQSLNEMILTEAVDVSETKLGDVGNFSVLEKIGMLYGDTAEQKSFWPTIGRGGY